MLFSQQYISELLTPINEASACGVYLKADRGAFRPLRNEFNVAQTSLRKLSQNPSSEEIEQLQEENLQNWNVLSESLMNNFRHVTRDIELIAWFIASQVVLDNSLDSTANSLNWLADLIEQNWDELNPVLPTVKLKSDSESGQQAEQADAKVKAFFQLAGESEESTLLYAPLLLLPLIGDVSFFDYQSAERKGEVSQLKQQVSSMVAHERSAIQNKLENSARCLEQIERLGNVVRLKAQAAGVQAANLTFLKTLFTKFDNALQQLSGMKVTPKTESPVAEQKTEATTVESVQPAPTAEAAMVNTMANAVVNTVPAEQGTPLTLSAGNLSQIAQANNMNRDLAFHLLREVSDFFRQSEPHSPVSFLLEKAIRWGYMSLPELLQEMMAEQDGDNLSNIFNAAGLNHLDQVLLPDVGIPAADIRNSSAPAEAQPAPVEASVEAQVSESSSADTPSKQQSDNSTSSGLTALSW